jgi:hypothetical protein
VIFLRRVHQRVGPGEHIVTIAQADAHELPGLVSAKIDLDDQRGQVVIEAPVFDDLAAQPVRHI